MYLLLCAQCLAQCLTRVDAEEVFIDLRRNRSPSDTAAGDREALGSSHVQAAEPWVLEPCLVAWKERSHGAGGMGSGIWTWLNLVVSGVTLGKLFNLPQQSPCQVSSCLRKGSLLSGKVAGRVKQKPYPGRCPARPGGVAQSVVTSLPRVPSPSPILVCLDTG